jgi:hypothetical protein
VNRAPDTHPRISSEEKDHIITALSKDSKDSGSMAIPWKSIFTSVPYMSVLASEVGNCFGAVVFFSNWPSYLKYMLGTDIRNGIHHAYLSWDSPNHIKNMTVAQGTISLSFNYHPVISRHETIIIETWHRERSLTLQQIS